MNAKFKVFGRFAGALISGGLLLSLTLPKRPETWHDAPDRSTSKIRLITHMEKNALQKQFIIKILQRGVDIDTTASRPGHLWSTVGARENYAVHFLIETSDSVETVSGEFGNPGLNAYGPNGIGHPPKASNFEWTTITYNSKGWFELTLIAQSDSAVVQYNSTL